MQIVLRQMVRHARQPRVHITTPQIFRADHLAGGCFYQRRAAEENGSLVFDDDGFIAHGRHIRAACGAGSHHHRDLRYALGGHIGLIEEDATEVIAIRKHFILIRQVRTTGVHQINTRQIILLRDFLRTQMLLDRHRIVSAALDGGVVAHDDAFNAFDAAYARDDAGARGGMVIHVVSGQLRKFKKRRAGIEQLVHALARQQLATCSMLFTGFFATAERKLFDMGAQIIDHCLHGGCIGRKLCRARVKLTLDDVHGFPCNEQGSGLEIAVDIQPATIATDEAAGFMQAARATADFGARDEFDRAFVTLML